MENYDDVNLQSQLDLLKQRLSIKEKEIEDIIQSQKEEYERNIRLRDEEVSQFVDNLVKENLELKKTIVVLQLEIEVSKDKLTEKQSEYYDNKSFYENLKLIKEKHQIKCREILEQHEKDSKVFEKENKRSLANLKRIANDNKNKLIEESGGNIKQGDSNNVFNGFSNGFISVSTFEENFLMFENKIKLLKEELHQKEKYFLVVEQKYEMILEENKMIKNKLKEEKTNIMRTIEEIQRENMMSYQGLIRTINEEIFDKKNTLENEIKSTINNSEALITEIVKEKNKLQDELDYTIENLNALKEKLNIMKKDNDDIQTKFDSVIEKIKHFEEYNLNYLNELKQIKIEKEILENSVVNMTRSLNDSYTKANQLEIENQSLKSNINMEIDKCELKSKNTIEVLQNEIASLNLQIKELKAKLDDERQNGKILLKMKKEISDLQSEIDIQNSELTKKETNYKILLNNYSDLKFQYEKCSTKYSTLEEENENRNFEIKSCKEKMAELEIESFTIKKEYNRILTVKDELFANYEESKRELVTLSSQYETLKVTSNIDIQRLRKQILEFEKVSGDSKKVNNLENISSNITNEMKSIKASIGKLYKTYLSILSQFEDKNDLNSINKINSFNPIKDHNSSEEIKHLEEIDKGLDKLKSIVNEKLKNSLSNNDPKLIVKYEDEIRELKNKLSTVIQITNSFNKTGNLNNLNSLNSLSSPNSSQMTKEPFASLKLAEKENSDSLFESIYIYLKNLNLTHLLQIFALNLQKEDEFKTILADKNSPNNLNVIKKQVADLSRDFTSLKKVCENYFNEFGQRAKMYTQPEEFEKKLEESKMFTQSLLDMVLDTLMNYKTEYAESVEFKMPIVEYNQFIETISLNIENFNKKVSVHIETQNKNAGSVQKALDSLIKSSTVDYEVLNSLMTEKLI